MKTIVNPLTLVIVLTTNFALQAQKREIKTGESTINWTGKKITGSHTGTLNFNDGYLTFQENQLTGGEFTVDMTSLTVTDLKAGSGKEKLEGHLNSDDFFGVENHKTSKLVIKNAEKVNETYKVEGDLTIKGTTNPITFDLKVEDDKATTNLKIDRTKYGIKYGSGSFFDNLGDKAIYDEFELAVVLKM